MRYQILSLALLILLASSQKPAAADTVANCADFTASDTECGANPTIVVARLLAAEVEDSSGSGPSVDCILNQFTAQAPSTWNDANLDICADAFPANTGAAGEPTQTCCNAAILTPLSELIVDKGKDTLRMAKNMKITKAIKEIFKVFKRCEWTPADFFTTNTEGTTEQPPEVQEIKKDLIDGVKAIVKETGKFDLATLCTLCADPAQLSNYFDANDRIRFDETSWNAYNDAVLTQMGDIENVNNNVKKLMDQMKTKVDEIGVDNVHQKCKSALGGAKRKFDGLAARCKDPLANSNGGGNNRFLQTVDGADLSAPPTEVPDAEKCNTRAKLAQTQTQFGRGPLNGLMDDADQKAPLNRPRNGGGNNGGPARRALQTTDNADFATDGTVSCQVANAQIASSLEAEATVVAGEVDMTSVDDEPASGNGSILALGSMLMVVLMLLA